MESVKINRLYDRDIANSIRDLVEESSYLKSKIFKSLIVVGELESDVPKSYKNFINDFIKIWEDYANGISSKIKTVKGVAGIYTVNYNYAKDFIYSKDDYASVLQFADGVIQGIKSEKFKEPDDVEDFFKFTVNKAFHDRGDSVAALLDSVLLNGISVDMYSKVTNNDAKLFDSVKSYKMFNGTDANELRKAAIKVVDFLSNELSDIIRELKYRNTKMFVSMVNHIVEYITYSLAAYATRVYLISQYVYPFIDAPQYAGDMNPPVAISESTKDFDEKMKPKLGEFDVAVNIMHNASELTCRDYSKVKEYVGILDTFSKAIGADALFGTNKPEPGRSMPTRLLNNDNAFVKGLIGNSLYEYIINYDSWSEMNYKSCNAELNHILKEYLYNSNQANPTSYTPKQELLYIIRGARYEDTVDGYKKLVKDMYIATGVLLCRIATIIEQIEYHINGYDAVLNTAEINYTNENLKMMKDLYSEIAVAFMHKGRDIELHFNNLKNAEISKLENDLSLKVPYQRLDLSTNINMMNSVPNTTRAPYDILDLYDLPTFESLEMYDDFLRSLPGMADDDYLSEAVGISSIINAIFSRIKSIFNRFASFIQDKRFQAGREWVIKHANDILSLDYNGKEIYVLPYKKNVTLPAGYNNLIKQLNSFDEKVMESDESRRAFIKSLYPSETIYNWFYGKNTDQSGPEMYRNHILFYDLNEVKKDVPAAVSISGATLHNALNNWITTMRQAPDTLNEFKRIKDQIESAVNNVKSKIVSMENASKQNEINKKDEMPPAASSTSNTDNNPKSDKPEEREAKPIEVPSTSGNKPGSDKPQNANEAFLIEIQTTIMRLWGSLSSIFIHYFLTEYKYIKDAYSIGRNNSN